MPLTILFEGLLWKKLLQQKQSSHNQRNLHQSRSSFRLFMRICQFQLSFNFFEASIYFSLCGYTPNYKNSTGREVFHPGFSRSPNFQQVLTLSVDLPTTIQDLRLPTKCANNANCEGEKLFNHIVKGSTTDLTGPRHIHCGIGA